MSASAAASSFVAASSSSSALLDKQSESFLAPPLPPRKRQRGEDDEDDEGASAIENVPVGSRVYLHRHALESIFEFSNIAGLATVMAVSRDWQAAVGSMRSIGHHWSSTPSGAVPIYLSRMRHHVTAIALDYDSAVTLETVALLHLRMPHSHSMTALVWPPLLRGLELNNIQAKADRINLLLRSFSVLSQLRELVLEMKHDSSLSFVPFAALPLLHALRVAWTGFVSPTLSDAQVDEFRALVDLVTFDVPMAAVSSLRLLRSPHALRWQVRPFPSWIGDDVCATLPSLSCLTQLTVDRSRCTNFDFLPRIQRLTQLKVGLWSDHPSADASTLSLMAALQHCPRIASLELDAERMPITSDQLAACLHAMPKLSTLHIFHASLPSLSFLSVLSLALSLRELRLAYSREPEPDVSELRHLHGLQSLRRLELIHALSEPLDDETRAVFEPPSVLLPSLQNFACFCTMDIMVDDVEEDEEEEEEDDEDEEEDVAEEEDE